MTEADVRSFIEENDVKFIRLAFCDVFGRLKNISVMPYELERAFSEGVSFDASAIDGFGDERRSDLFLHPDAATAQLLPWRPSHGRVARFFCSVRYPDGTPFELDCRGILQEAENAAKKLDISCNFGAECEFYLFRTDDNGEDTRIPFDRGGYMDVAPEDRGENVRREICLSLEEMDILPTGSHHEEGPGQNEIDFRYSEPVNSADNVITFKSVVKNVAQRNGLFASFSPKPLPGQSGSGMHVNMSPVRGNEDIRDAFMAGILAHIREMTLFCDPLPESYLRLGGHKAPKYVTWSPENRSQLIRIPAAKGEHSRIELRSPDTASNPYLVFALLLYAGIDGVSRGLTAPAPMNENLYTAGADVTASLDTLPASFEEAVFAAVNSSFIGGILPQRLIDDYAARPINDK